MLDDRVIREFIICNLGEKCDVPDGGELSNNVLCRQGDDDFDEGYEEDGEDEYDARDNADKQEQTPEEHALTEDDDDDQFVQ